MKKLALILNICMALVNSMKNKNKPKFKPDPKLKLIGQMRQVLRYHHYSYRTEQT